MSKQLHEDVLKTQEVQKSQSFSFVIPTTKCNWKNSTLVRLGVQPSKQMNHKEAEIYH